MMFSGLLVTISQSRFGVASMSLNSRFRTSCIVTFIDPPPATSCPATSPFERCMSPVQSSNTSASDAQNTRGRSTASPHLHRPSVRPIAAALHAGLPHHAASRFHFSGSFHADSAATTRVPFGPHTPSVFGFRLLSVSA